MVLKLDLLESIDLLLFDWLLFNDLDFFISADLKSVFLYKVSWISTGGAFWNLTYLFAE